MQKRIQRVKSVFTGLAGLTAAILGLTACSSQWEAEESVVSVKKDGTVSHVIRESFDEEYFDLDELQDEVLQAVVSYNSLKGEETVTVTKVQLTEAKQTEGRMITDVEMEYRSPEDYAEFNRETFFVGTPEQAQAAGYDLNRVFVGSGDDTQTIGMAELLESEELLMLITNTDQIVAPERKIQYISEHVEMLDNGKAFRRAAASGEQDTDYIYIIFKE